MGRHLRVTAVNRALIALLSSVFVLAGCPKGATHTSGGTSTPGGNSGNEPSDAGPNGTDGGSATLPSGTAPTQPASVLIDAALAEGRIDGKTAALYSALAQFAPGRLPVEFQGLEDVASTIDLLAVARHLGEYPPDEAAVAGALLASPDDPSWLAFPAGYPLRGFGMAGTTCFGLYGIDNNAQPRWVGGHTDTKHFRFMG